MNVADARCGRDPVAVAGGVAQLGKQAVEVQWQRRHLNTTGLVLPLGAGAIAIDLDSVALGIGQIQSLAHEMVGCPAQAPAGVGDASESGRELRAVRYEDRKVEQPRRPRRSVLSLWILIQLDDGGPVGAEPREAL